MILIYYAQSYLSASSIYQIIRHTLSACGIAAHCLDFSEKLCYFWPENSRKGRISYHGQLIGFCRLNSLPLSLKFLFWYLLEGEDLLRLLVLQFLGAGA